MILRLRAIVGALILTLTLSTSALAASTGTLTETIVVSTSISLTIPSSASYIDTGSVAAPFVWRWTTPGVDALMTTNNPTGMTLTGKASNFTGPVGAPLSSARFVTYGAAGGGIAVGPTPNGTVTGDFALPTTVVSLAKSTASTPAGSLNIVFRVGFAAPPLPGTYGGSIDFAVTTNP